jgi:inosine-uridine nucleoside N-ribohydrolase
MKRIWIDTDIAMGMSLDAPSRDVDDGWAVAILLCAATIGKVRIAGISVCDGNTDAVTALECMQSLLRVMGIDNVPVIARDDAATSIAALQSGTMLLALGPLTNIVGALAIDPVLAQRASLITVGGVHNRWNFRRRLSDLNIRRDPHAAAIVHSAFIDCRRMPLDVIDRLTIDQARMDRIGASGAMGDYAAIEALPGAQYDVQNRLTAFDVSETWRVVESLLAG